MIVMWWVLGHQYGLQEPSVPRVSELHGFMSYSQQTVCVCVAGKGKSSCCLFSSNILICSSNTANLMKPQMQFVKHFSSLIGKTMWMLREIAKDGADSFIFTWSHRCVDLINTPDSQSLPKQTSKNIYKVSYTNIITQPYLSSYSVQNHTDVGTLGKCVL